MIKCFKLGVSVLRTGRYNTITTHFEEEFY